VNLRRCVPAAGQPHSIIPEETTWPKTLTAIMNQKEKLILKTLQSDFPIVKHPYRALARRLGISRASLLLAIKSLKEKGTIRRIGAVLSAKHVGYTSVLIGLSVPEKKTQRAALLINRSRNVSHNYLRDSEFNIWFTYSAKTQREINSFVRRLENNKQIQKILILPSEKVFKINTEFML